MLGRDDSFLSAVLSYQGREEDRLTEIFAATLRINHNLAQALFETVGLPGGDRFRVVTQKQVAPRCRPDMQIEALDGSRARIWSEHKVGAGFREMQREDYLRELRALPGAGELLFIV